MMLAKHLVLILLIAMAVLGNVFVRRAGHATDEPTCASALHRPRLNVEVATGLSLLGRPERLDLRGGA